jgi:hypothetical protein
MVIIYITHQYLSFVFFFHVLIYLCKSVPVALAGTSAKKSTVPDCVDSDEEETEKSSPDSSQTVRRLNSKGLVVMRNGVVSMRDLGLAHRVP